QASVLDSGAMEHAVALLYSTGDSVVIPPGGNIDFILPATTRSGWITYQPAPIATLAMVDADLLADLTDKKLATAKANVIVDCLRDVVGSARDGGVARFALAKCVTSVLQQNLDLAKLGAIRRLGARLVA